MNMKFQPTPSRSRPAAKWTTSTPRRSTPTQAAINTPGRDHPHDAEAGDQVAGDEARREHAEHVPLDDGGALGEAEAAGEHRQRGRGHQEVHGDVGHERGEERRDRRRLARDRRERPAGAGAALTSRPQRVQKAQRQADQTAQEGDRGEAAGEHDRREQVLGPPRQQRAEQRRHRAPGHHPADRPTTPRRRIQRTRPGGGVGRVSGGEAVELAERAEHAVDQPGQAERGERAAHDRVPAEDAGGDAEQAAEQEARPAPEPLHQERGWQHARHRSDELQPQRQARERRGRRQLQPDQRGRADHDRVGHEEQRLAGRQDGHVAGVGGVAHAAPDSRRKRAWRAPRARQGAVWSVGRTARSGPTPRDDEVVRQIRAGVQALCAEFPGAYWRELDRWAPRPDVHHGHAAAARQRGAEARYLPKIATASCACRRSASPSRPAGSDTTRVSTTAVREGDHYVVNGQKIWTSRAEHSDLMLLLARTTPRDAGRRKDRGPVASSWSTCATRREGPHHPADRTMINHATTELFFDDLEVPAENLIGEEGQGFRYILDGMNAERILIAAECIGDARWFIERAALRQGARRVRPADRPEPGRPVPDRPRLRQTAAADLMRGARRVAVRRRPALRRRGEHGQAARLRGVLGRRRQPACRPTAASASPRSTTSSASSARRGSTRSRRSPPTWSWPTSPSTSWNCPAPTERRGDAPVMPRPEAGGPHRARRQCRRASRARAARPRGSPR